MGSALSKIIRVVVFLVVLGATAYYILGNKPSVPSDPQIKPGIVLETGKPPEVKPEPPKAGAYQSPETSELPSSARAEASKPPVDAPKPPTKPEAKPEPKIATPSSTPATIPTTGAATLKLGTWNIEWLGNPEKRSGLATGTAQSADDLADYIIASGVSVLALEEIGPTAGNRRSKELDAAIAVIAQRTKDTWKYELFAGRDSSEQLTGVMWNPKLVTPIDSAGKPLDETKADGFSVPLPPMRGTQTRLWNKPPVAMKFSAGAGKLDFVIIVVHMKADYQGDFALTRDEEAKNLIAGLPAVKKQFSDKDVIVLGDTNMTKDNEPVIATFASAGLFNLNTKSERTNWREGAMDRIFVPSDRPAFADHKFAVMSDRYLESKRWTPRDFKKRLSDHYMAVTEIKIVPDDD